MDGSGNSVRLRSSLQCTDSGVHTLVQTPYRSQPDRVHLQVPFSAWCASASGNRETHGRICGCDAVGCGMIYEEWPAVNAASDTTYSSTYEAFTASIAGALKVRSSLMNGTISGWKYRISTCTHDSNHSKYCRSNNMFHVRHLWCLAWTECVTFPYQGSRRRSGSMTCICTDVSKSYLLRSRW